MNEHRQHRRHTGGEKKSAKEEEEDEKLYKEGDETIVGGYVFMLLTHKISESFT